MPFQCDDPVHFVLLLPIIKAMLKRSEKQKRSNRYLSKLMKSKCLGDFFLARPVYSSAICRNRECRNRHCLCYCSVYFDLAKFHFLFAFITS